MSENCTFILGKCWSIRLLNQILSYVQRVKPKRSDNILKT